MKSLALAAFVLSWVVAAPAWAHKPSDAHLRLAVEGDTITGRLDIAVRDLDGALGLDQDGNGEITWAELSASAPRIAAYVEHRLVLGADGAPCTQHVAGAALADLSDGAYWSVAVSATCPRAPRTLDIAYALLFDIDSMHRGLAHVGGQTVILRDARPVRITLDEATSVVSFVREGVWHIWMGIDHIMFLLCLILPAVFQRRTQRWSAADSLGDVCREVFEIVTAFTLAHSITLGLAAMKWVSLSPGFIEPAIAVTIMLAALDNVRPIFGERRAFVTFFFGLIHGFGFAGVLSELNLPASEFAWALLQFNLGIELGQLTIVAAAIALLFVLRERPRYPGWVIRGGSFAAMFIGLLWFIERTADVSLLPM
jgi:hypothetical protein